MTIYADKKAGKLTGWFRIEVQGRGRRLRDRLQSIDEAKRREEHFRECIVLGREPRNERTNKRPAKAPVSPVARIGRASGPASLSTLRLAAHGRVWRGGTTGEDHNLAKLRIIEATMGDTELDAIDTSWIEDLKMELLKQRGISEHTINRYLACLSKALKWAVKMNLRTAPMPEVEGYREESGRIRVVSRDEEAKAYQLLDDRMGRTVRIAIRTGMRRGELLTVEPSQIRPGWVDLWKTKSGSPRAIPLTPEDEADLRWLADSRMPTVQQLRVAWRRLKATLAPEDEDFVFHCTRHTFATRAVEKGVHPRVLQQLMGHKTFKMTERYTHMSDSLLHSSLAQMFA